MKDNEKSTQVIILENEMKYTIHYDLKHLMKQNQVSNWTHRNIEARTITKNSEYPFVMTRYAAYFITHD